MQIILQIVGAALVLYLLGLGIAEAIHYLQGLRSRSTEGDQ
jgi:hypothetical protein